MCVYILYIIIIYLNYLSKRYIEKRIGPRNIRLCIRIDKYQIFIDFTWDLSRKICWASLYQAVIMLLKITSLLLLIADGLFPLSFRLHIYDHAKHASQLLVVRISSFPNNLLASFSLCPSLAVLKCGGMILIEGITGPGLDANTL